MWYLSGRDHAWSICGLCDSHVGRGGPERVCFVETKLWIFLGYSCPRWFFIFIYHSSRWWNHTGMFSKLHPKLCEPSEGFCSALPQIGVLGWVFCDFHFFPERNPRDMTERAERDIYMLVKVKWKHCFSNLQASHLKCSFRYLKVIWWLVFLRHEPLHCHGVFSSEGVWVCYIRLCVSPEMKKNNFWGCDCCCQVGRWKKEVKRI